VTPGTALPAEAQPAEERWLRFALPASMIVAVALRLLHWRSTATVHNDGPVFIALAHAFEDGDFAAALGHEFHPLYPAAIALTHLLLAPLGIGWETAGVLTSAVASAGAVWALHAFVRSAFGPREAAFAAALLAVHGGAVDMGADVQSEGLYLALFLGCAAALWSALRTASLRSAALAGALSGLAYLTRPEGLAMLGAGGLVAFGLLVSRRWSPRVAIGFGCALGLGAACCVAPYIGSLYADTGELWLTRKKSVGWIAGLSGPPKHFAGERQVPDWNEQQTPAGLELPRPDPPLPPVPPPPVEDETSVGSRLAAASADLVQSTFRAVRYELLLFLLLGLHAAGRPPGLRAAFVGAVLGVHLVVLFGLSFNVGYVSTRHLMGPATLLLGYVACSLTPLGAAVARVTRRRLGAATAAALVLTLAGSISLSRALRDPDPEELVQRDAAVWLRDQAGESGPVAARKRRVAYYAGAPFVKLRAKSPARLVRHLDAYGVQYVVVGEHEVGEYSGMAAMIPELLEPVHREQRGDAAALVLRYTRALPIEKQAP
jgi:hypothetical protein